MLSTIVFYDKKLSNYLYKGNADVDCESFGKNNEVFLGFCRLKDFYYVAAVAADKFFVNKVNNVLVRNLDLEKSLKSLKFSGTSNVIVHLKSLLLRLSLISLMSVSDSSTGITKVHLYKNFDAVVIITKLLKSKSKCKPLEPFEYFNFSKYRKLVMLRKCVNDELLSSSEVSTVTSLSWFECLDKVRKQTERWHLLTIYDNIHFRHLLRKLLLRCGDLEDNPGPGVANVNDGVRPDRLRDLERGTTSTGQAQVVESKNGKCDLQVITLNVRGLGDAKK